MNTIIKVFILAPWRTSVGLIHYYRHYNLTLCDLKKVEPYSLEVGGVVVTLVALLGLLFHDTWCRMNLSNDSDLWVSVGGFTRLYNKVIHVIWKEIILKPYTCWLYSKAMPNCSTIIMIIPLSPKWHTNVTGTRIPTSCSNHKPNQAQSQNIHDIQSIHFQLSRVYIYRMPHLHRCCKWVK